MRNHRLDIVAWSFFIMTAAWIASNFLFLCMGEIIVIKEPNPYIRIPEFILSLAVLGLAIERWINCVRRKR